MNFLIFFVGAVLAAPAIAQVKTAEQARAAVRAELRDPASAQFRSVRSAPGGVWCGDVNSRNGFGGMTGFKAFLIDRDGDLQWLEELQYTSADAWENFIRTQMVSPVDMRAPKLDKAERAISYWESQVLPCLDPKVQPEMRASLLSRRADIQKAR